MLHSDSTTAVAVLPVRRGRDPFIPACAREIWWTCEVNDIALNMLHTRGDQLTDAADALSQYHLGGVFKDRVQWFRGCSHGVSIIPVSHALFKLSPDL